MNAVAVLNGSRVLPKALAGMDDKDFWKEWGEHRAQLARIEAQQGFVSATVLRLEQREQEAAGKRSELERQVNEIKTRIAELEGKGFAAWSAKRLTQLSALVAALAAIFGAVFALVQWLIAHSKFGS